MACVYLLDLSLIPHSCHTTLSPSFTLFQHHCSPHFCSITHQYSHSRVFTHTVLSGKNEKSALFPHLLQVSTKLSPFHSDLSWPPLNKHHPLQCHNTLSPFRVFFFFVCITWSALLAVVSRTVPGM